MSSLMINGLIEATICGWHDCFIVQLARSQILGHVGETQPTTEAISLYMFILYSLYFSQMNIQNVERTKLGID